MKLLNFILRILTSKLLILQRKLDIKNFENETFRIFFIV